MAENAKTVATKEERISEAKELFGHGSRNYCMKQYADAADDLSECCSIYSELYGPNAEELGLPYLMYAKSLIALGKDENNLIAAADGKDEDEVDDDDDEEDDEEENGDGGEEKVEGEKVEEKENEAEAMDTKEQSGDGSTPAEKANESKQDKTDEKVESAESVPGPSGTKEENGEPQPGPSTSNGTGNGGAQEEAADNLQVAWEILELAVNIFQQQGEKGLENLPECYIELAGISFENSFFKEAIKDYVKALEIYKKTAKPDLRLLAEVNYKVGLCYMMESEFEESIKSFKGAVAELEKVVEQEEAKEQTDDIKETILDLKEMKKEILEKITDVEDAMKTPIENVKRELSKIIVSGGGASNGKDVNNGAGSSSSAAAAATAGGSSNGSASSSSTAVAAKPATDISHLIKRKKPDTVSAEVEGSPAKKTASETENVASHNTSA